MANKGDIAIIGSFRLELQTTLFCVIGRPAAPFYCSSPSTPSKKIAAVCTLE
jgi:hypothetical protein